jgi:uncharacterized membrane protein YkoI
LKYTFRQTAAVLFLALAMSNSAVAQNNDKADDKAEAAKRAQAQVKGRVLKVDQSKDKYRVKVLQKSGRVVSVDVDKNTDKPAPKKSDKDK